jgi:hypothetical protein
VILFCGLVGTGLLGFAIGTSVGERTMLSVSNVQLEGVQAMLNFNHLDEERRLQSLLAKGCVDASSKEVDIQINLDKEVIADLLRRATDSDAIKYISDRDPKLIDELKSFKNKYGKSWPTPDWTYFQSFQNPLNRSGLNSV